MQIAIVSDTHFGYKWGAEREQDAFDSAREAFERTVDADLVVLPGDIFDKKVPKQEVLGEAVDCFNVYRRGTCEVSIAEESDVTHEFHGTPVVAIHGTHERRSQEFTNPIELLEKMDYLLHLHNEKVVFEKDGETVAVHGMSGVPERFAPTVLKKFAPEPVPDAFNIFVFHQSVENLVYTSPDHDALTMEDLPEGFDLLVDGHIHWFQHIEGDKELVIPGSTVTTQMNKVEAEQPKGFVTVDTDSGELAFHELDTPRELFYEEIDIEGMDGNDVLDTVRERLEPVLSGTFDRKPLVRLILKGETSATLKQSELTGIYADDAIMSVSLDFGRQQVSSGGAAVQEETSVAEMGMATLTEKIGRDLPLEELFELLAEQELDGALDLVEEMDVPDREEDSEDDGEGEAGEDGAPEQDDRPPSEQPKTLADF